MPHPSTAAIKLARRHWFLLLLPVWFACSFAFSRSLDWRLEGRMGEATILFDWCVFLPFAYALSLRRAVPPRAALLRTLGLAGAGLWVGRLFVPDGAENLLTSLGWLRYPWLAVVLVVEGAVIVALLRAVFAGRADAAAFERAGVPPFAAKLMLLEARFWRWVWRTMRGG